MRLILLAILGAAPVSAQTAMMVPAAPAPAAVSAPAPAPATAKGYIDGMSPLAMLRLLPPPPEAGSHEDKADRFLYREGRRGIGGPAWQRAIGQLSITSPAYMKAVSCALGATLSPQTTPATMTLLRRAGMDLAKAVFAAKDYYKRPRPFSTDGGKACDPDHAVDGGKPLGFAYPSGHAAVGWLWGLILSDARPSRSAEVLKFGKDTGDLRVACRVHWASDVTGGRLMATALYQRIEDSADYKADLRAARAELPLTPVPEGCPAS
jgi:acid phosphatase (class A)